MGSIQLIVKDVHQEGTRPNLSVVTVPFAPHARQSNILTGNDATLLGKFSLNVTIIIAPQVSRIEETATHAMHRR